MTTTYGWLQRPDGALELRMPPGVRSDDYVVLRQEVGSPETWRGEAVHRGVPDVVHKYGPHSLEDAAHYGEIALIVWNPSPLPETIPLPSMIAVKREWVEAGDHSTPAWLREHADKHYWTVVDTETLATRCSGQRWREVAHAVKYAELRIALDAQENARVEAVMSTQEKV